LYTEHHFDLKDWSMYDVNVEATLWIFRTQEYDVFIGKMVVEDVRGHQERHKRRVSEQGSLWGSDL
jgi:hypothetical protein